MDGSPVASLYAALSDVADPRCRRGVRHPFTGILGLVLLGMICRQVEVAALRRWAKRHWGVLRGPLGFTRPEPPHATTISRAVARFSLAQFQAAFARWVAAVMGDARVVAAVDGKTSKQGHDADGDPVHMLNLFAQDLKLCLGQWPLAGGKATEPEALKAHLDEIFAAYPSLHAITGDALFAQRPLAALIVAAGRDYLLQLKANQPDLLEATRACFAAADDAAADATAVEKKGARSRPAASGSTSIASATSPRRPASPG